MPHAFTERLTAAVRKAAGERCPAALDWVLQANGTSSTAAKLVLFGLGEDGPTPQLVAKVARTAPSLDHLRDEFGRSRRAWDAYGRGSGVCLPEPLGLFAVDGCLALVMTFAPGARLLARVARLAGTDALLADAAAAAQLLGRVHDHAAAAVAAAARPESGLAGDLAAFARQHAPTPAERAALAALAARDEAAVRTHDTLVHGDFWHGNVLHDKRTGRLWLVDWEHSCRASDVNFDVFHFLLAAAIAANPPAAPDAAAPAAVATLRRWRRRLVPAYLAAYRAASRADGRFPLLPVHEGILAACVRNAVRDARLFGTHSRYAPMWRGLVRTLAQLPERDRL